MVKQRQRIIAKTLSTLLPGVPYADAEKICIMAYAPHMKSLPPSLAVRLAIIAYIRHQYTNYDDLRDNGYDVDSARFFSSEQIQEKLNEWRANFALQIDDLS